MTSFAPAVVPAACRNGKRLVVSRGAALPANCVKCGAPAQRPWRKKFYWHHPAYYLLILPSLLIYAIVAIIIRKSMELNVPLCEIHHGERRRYNILAAVLMLGAVPAGFIIGEFFSAGAGIGWLVGALMFIAGAVFLAIAGSFLRPVKIDERGAIFTGAGENFLQLLPPEPQF